MICIVAAIVLSVMGIFSATHRALAKEALDCVFRRITLRPCNTGFNVKVKSKILGFLLPKSEVAARLFNKYTEVFSWIFFLLMVWSTYYVIDGAYKYYLWGNCNGLNSTSFCVFDPTGENSKVSALDTACPAVPVTEQNLTLGEVNPADYPHKIFGEGKSKVIFIGSYYCDYTRKEYPVIRKLAEEKNVDLTFMEIPIKPEVAFLSNYTYCAYKLDQNKFWDWNDKMFSAPKPDLLKDDLVMKIAIGAGYDETAMKECVYASSTQTLTAKQTDDIKNTGIFGTPTVFVNDQALVGPKPERIYKRLIGN